jgi:hypothetical protein
MMSTLTRILLASLCLGVTLLGATPVYAAKKKTTHHRVSKNKNSGKDKESADERRLKRECKGQVNAGACAGYTR